MLEGNLLEEDYDCHLWDSDQTIHQSNKTYKVISESLIQQAGGLKGGGNKRKAMPIAAS
jgi:hypothetical protein